MDFKYNRIIIANKIFKGQQEALLLTPEALKIVEQARKLAEFRGDEKLFVWDDTNAPNKIIKRLERKLGMKADGRGLQGFRRAFCNRLFERGLDIVDIQEIMRHRNIETTLNYYKEFKQSLLVKKMGEKL